MMRIANFSRWFISITCLLQGIFFLAIAYWAYGFERAFHAQRLADNLIQNATFFSVGIISIWIGCVFFIRRGWAKYLVALLLSGVIIWFLSDALSERLELFGLVLALPQAIALGFLLATWRRNGVDRIEKLA